MPAPTPTSTRSETSPEVAAWEPDGGARLPKPKPIEYHVKVPGVRFVTMCGASPGFQMWTIVSARRKVRTGDTADICVGCLTALEIEMSDTGTAS